MTDIPSEIEPIEEKANPFRITETGIVVEGETTIDDWFARWQTLIKLHRAVQWSLADMIIYAEDSKPWGEMYAQALRETDYTVEYLRNIVSVARAYELPDRSDKVSFSHHERIKIFPPEVRKQAIMTAINQDLNRDECRLVAQKIYDDLYKVQRDPEPERSKVLSNDPILPVSGQIVVDVSRFTDPPDLVTYFVTVVREVRQPRK